MLASVDFLLTFSQPAFAFRWLDIPMVLKHCSGIAIKGIDSTLSQLMLVVWPLVFTLMLSSGWSFQFRCVKGIAKKGSNIGCKAMFLHSAPK